MNKDLLNVVGNFIETELDYVEKSNNEIKQLQNQVEKLIQENNDMEELLNKQYQDGYIQGKFNNEIKVLELQSVINELEKWLKGMLDSEKDIFSVIRVKDVLDKLNELRSKE